MNELDRRVNFWVHQPVYVKVVLIQMAYQLGVGGLLTFKRFLTALNEKNYDLAIKEMFDSRWAMQTPNRVKALADYIKNMPLIDNQKAWKEDMRSIIEISDSLNGFSLFD
jgi:hypothetical protein